MKVRSVYFPLDVKHRQNDPERDDMPSGPSRIWSVSRFMDSSARPAEPEANTTSPAEPAPVNAPQPAIEDAVREVNQSPETVVTHSGGRGSFVETHALDRDQRPKSQNTRLGKQVRRNREVWRLV